MGDRVTVFFKSNNGDVSPGIYIHWGGAGVLSLIADAASRMRRGDPIYSAARFCGHCHGVVKGNAGLGLVPPPDADTDAAYEKMSPGDAGSVVVNIDTGEIVAYDSYLSAESIAPLDIEKVPE